MRQLDAFQSYFDNEGKFLIGRLRFCTTQSVPTNVYDVDGTSIGTEVTTTASGRLSQEVFLSDIDYLIYVDKWIGEGSIDVSDEDNWLNIGSFNNRYNILGIDVESSGVQCVPNMEALKAQNPATIAVLGDRKYVTLLGYNSPGDKEPVYYYWDPTNSDDDNDGNIVKYTGSELGRWIMSINDKVDVRDFGAFPNESCVEDSEQRGRIAVSASVASQINASLYFGGSGYYDITNVNNLRNVCASTGVYLSAKSNTNVTYVSVRDSSVKFANDSSLDESMCGSIRLTGDTLCSSQDYSNCGFVDFRPVYKFVNDTANWTGGLRVFSNIEFSTIQLLKGPASFTNCNIFSNGYLKASEGQPLIFSDCILDESMFSELNDLNYCTFTRCRVRTWDTVQFAIAVGTNVFDGEGRTVHNTQTLPSGKFSNIVFEGDVICPTGTDQLFDNCTFKGHVTGKTMRLIDCTVIGEYTISSVDVGIHNSTIHSVIADNIIIRNSVAENIGVTYSLVAANVTTNYCSNNPRAGSFGPVNIDLRNFVASGNSEAGMIVANATALTGRTMNIVGGIGVSDYIDDSNTYRNPVTFNGGLTTAKFNQGLRFTSEFPTITPSGFSGTSFVDVSQMYSGLGLSRGSQIILFNNNSSSPVNVKLWSAVKDSYNIIGYVKMLNGETLRLTYMGDNQYAVQWETSDTSNPYKWVNIANLLAVDDNSHKLKVATGSHV